MRRLRTKLMWWLAFAIPKQAALYAFVRVHGITGEGPSYDGEYARAYKLWTEKYEIES